MTPLQDVLYNLTYPHYHFAFVITYISCKFRPWYLLILPFYLWSFCCDVNEHQRIVQVGVQTVVVISIKRLTIWFTTASTLNPKRQYQRPLGTVPTTSMQTSCTVPPPTISTSSTVPTTTTTSMIFRHSQDFIVALI